MEASTDAIVLVARDGVIRGLNPAAESLYGHSNEAIVGELHDVLLPDSSSGEALRNLLRLQSEHRVDHYEARRVTREGHELEVSISISALRDAAGNLVGYAEAGRDMTDRRRAEQETREGDRRFRELVDAAPVLVWISDSSKAGVYFNELWLEFTGMPLERQLGAGWLDAVHPDDCESLETACRAAFEERRPFTTQFRLRRFDGEYRWMLDTGSPRFAEDERFLGFIGSCIDITDRKRGEEALRLLAECGAALTAPRDLNKTLDAVANCLVPTFADCCVIDIVGVEGQLSLHAIAHVDERQASRIEAMRTQFTTPGDRDLIVSRVIRTGKPELVTRVDEETLHRAAANESHRRILDSLELVSVAVVPLESSDGVFGAMTIATTKSSGRIYTAPDLDLFAEVGRRTSEALETARLYERLSERENLLQSYYHASPFLMGVVELVDDERDILHLYDNPATAQFFNVEFGATHGRRASELGAPADILDRWIAAYTRCREVNTSVAFEYEHVVDGDRCWLRAIVSSLGPGRQGDRFSYIVENRTRRRQVELSLYESELRFRAAFEQAPFAIQTFAPNGDIRTVNPEWRRLWKAPESGLEGYNILEDATLAEKNLLPEIQRAFDGERITLTSIRYDPARNDRPGRPRWVDVSLYPLLDDEDRVFEVVLVCDDVTESIEAQQALRENEERFRLATIAGEIGVWDWDLSTARVTWSRTMESVVGATAKVFDGTPQSFLRRVHQADRRMVMHTIRRALANTEAVGLEFRMRSDDGSERWMYANAQMVREESGEAVRLLGAMVDISERRRAEETRALLAAIVESSQDAIVSKTLNGVITSWNQGAERLFGYTAAEAIGQSIYLVIPHDRYDEETNILSKIRAGERVEHYETVRRTKSGRLIDVSLAVSPLLDEKGRVIGASKVARDVTERKRSEAALRDAQNRLRVAVEAGSVGTWMYDLRSGRMVTDAWLSQMLEIEPSAAAAGITIERFLESVAPDDRDRVDDAIRRTIETGAPYQIEYRLASGRRGTRWVMAKGRIESGESGSISYFAGALSEITERKRHEEQMRLVMAELNHRVKNTLASVQAIASQTMRYTSSSSEFEQAFTERLRSLAQAHSLLTRTNWEGVDLRDIAESELKPRLGTPDQARIDGPSIILRPKEALSLHLVMHEMCTNAAKYGALSSNRGLVKVAWRVEVNEDDQPRLHLVWSESDGPEVHPPSRRGFGSRIIERTVRYELNGDCELRFDSSGVSLTIDAPAPATAREGGDPMMTF